MTTVSLGTVPIVINRKYGGFGLSRAAYDWLKAKGSELVDDLAVETGQRFGYEDFYPDYDRFPNLRAHPDLVGMVRELGDAANGSFAKLVIEDVSLDVEIEDFDGMERIVR
jgi:hypothetical protein